jgi:hypothetical protein
MLKRLCQLSPAAKEGHADDGRDRGDSPEDRGHDFDDVTADLFVVVYLFRRWSPLAIVIFVLDLAAVTFEAFPADARYARVIVGPAAHTSVEAPVDTQVRLLTVSSGAMFRTDALPGQRVLVVGR